MTTVERVAKRAKQTFQTMFLTKLKEEVGNLEEIVLAKWTQVEKA